MTLTDLTANISAQVQQYVSEQTAALQQDVTNANAAVLDAQAGAVAVAAERDALARDADGLRAMTVQQAAQIATLQAEIAAARNDLA